MPTLIMNYNDLGMIFTRNSKISNWDKIRPQVFINPSLLPIHPHIPNRLRLLHRQPLSGSNQSDDSERPLNHRSPFYHASTLQKQFSYQYHLKQKFKDEKINNTEVRIEFSVFLCPKRLAKYRDRIHEDVNLEKFLFRLNPKSASH